MKQQILTQFPWPWMPTVALLIFFVLFVGLIFRVLNTSKVAVFDHAARLPFEEGEIYE